MDRLVSLSVNKENFEEIYPRILQAGVTLPQVYYGKKTVLMTWTPMLGRERLREILLND